MPSRKTTKARSRLPKSSSSHADRGDLDDRVVAGQAVLDLLGEDVLAAGDDHLVVAALDVQQPVLVEAADVAGRHQPVDHVLVAAAGVALEEQAVADEDPAGLTLRELLADFSS